MPRKNLIGPLFSGAITFFPGQLPHFLVNSNCTPEVVDKTWGDASDRTDNFSEGLIGEENDVNANVLDPLLHSFTTEEGAIVKVYDACRQGICSCDYQLSGEMLQLKPCRFAYLVSLGTAECKKAYEPLVSNITDGFKVVDDNMDLSEMQYECENYSSVYTPENKAKLDNIIGKELSEGYLKIVNSKPVCIHSMGAVPKPGGGIRPTTDCSMPKDISVNNFCADIIQDFQYKNVDHVLAMLQEGDYVAVVDIKSAYRAVPIFPDHRKYLGLKWEINGETVFIEDSRLCFGLCLGPSYFDKISGFVYNILADMYNIQAVNYLDDFWLYSHWGYPRRSHLGSKNSYKNPKVFRVLHFLGQGHPTIPGVQISRFGHRFHKYGNKAPKRQIGEIDKSTQKICGEKYNFQKRAGEFGGSFGSLLPCGGWR